MINERRREKEKVAYPYNITSHYQTREKNKIENYKRGPHYLRDCDSTSVPVIDLGQQIINGKEKKYKKTRLHRQFSKKIQCLALVSMIVIITVI